MAQFHSYLRVSTTKQGFDGLGVESQREAVRRYCNQTGGELLGEFVEVESGKRNDRPVLTEALGICRSKRTTLVIAKLDRLGRSVSFIAGLMDARVPFVAVDMPFATPLLLHVMAAFAQHEREMISGRTRGALAAAKARGVVLGAHGKVLAEQHRSAAKAHAEALRPAILQAQEAGCLSLPQIADYLTAQGHQTASEGRWHPMSVKRVLDRIRAD